MDKLKTIIQRYFDSEKDKKIESLSCLIEDIQNEFETNNELIEYIHQNSQCDNKQIINIIRKECKNYKRVEEAYSSGDLSNAINILKQILFPENEKCPMETIELNKTSQIFFRARIHEEYEIYPRKEMFHVPLDRKNIISNQRYSINGFPCLYLGASLYDCWEELRRADLEKLNFVGYRYVKARPLRFLLIDYRVKFDSADTWIKRIILFLLCTWIVSDDRKKFKFEYVIPELILHALISYNNQQTNMLEKYDGIAYISSRFFKPNCMYKNNHNKMMNYVIPPVVNPMV